MKHTSGPWRMEGAIILGGGTMVADANPLTRCADWQANACLIAAAPELLEMVYSLRDELGSANPNVGKWIELANKLIKQAEGNKND